MQHPLVSVPTALGFGCLQLIFPLNVVAVTASNVMDITASTVLKLLPEIVDLTSEVNS